MNAGAYIDAGARRPEAYEASELAATYFERQLREHPLRRQATSELAARGITDAARAFRVGYAPPEEDGLTAFLAGEGAMPVATKIGLLCPTDDKYCDRFRHRLMFPVCDADGRVIAFTGRHLDPPAHFVPHPLEARVRPRYVTSRESWIFIQEEEFFGLHQARAASEASGRLVVVEGVLDVVALHARGIDEAVAPLHWQFTETMAGVLKRYARQVVFVYDPDRAGSIAAHAALDACRKVALDARMADLPAGTNADAFTRARGAEPLRHLLSSVPVP